MQSIKSYTDIAQSKKLAEILPIESADICYIKHASSNNPNWEFNEDFPPMILGNVPINKITAETLPCWSLAALLKLIPNPTLKLVTTDYWKIVWGIGEIDCDGDFENFGTVYGNTPIDAAYNTIVYLHELNLL